MDADLQDDPRDLGKFLEKIDDGADLVMGLRECRSHARIMRLAGGLYDLMILALFDSPFHSSSASFVAFRSDLVRDIPFRNNDHRYLPLVALRRGAENVSEILVRHNPRQWGVSKYRPFKKLVLGVPQTLLFLVRYRLGVYDAKR